MTHPAWADAIVANAGETRTANRLVAGLEALEREALAFCRLLERWARGDAEPGTAAGRGEALQGAAERVEAALEAIERPLGRYLIELAPERAEGSSWFGEPGQAELVDWEPVLVRAGVAADPHRVTAAYLELAVLIRALEGLSAAVGFEAGPDRGSLWAGLFDLRENLLGRAQDELRALAA
ncbi:MAG TPA: hypothetical protein VGM80_01370 [Gaiellaceae bacterium]